MPAGSFFGALLVTQLADSRLGRRNTVILAGIVWVIGSILQCAAVVCICRFKTILWLHAFLTYLSNHRTVACLWLAVWSPGFLSVSLVLWYPSINRKSPLLLFVVAWSRSSNGNSPFLTTDWLTKCALRRSITWGILIQYFVQFGCSYIDGVASFRIPWGLQMIPAIILSLGMVFFPESPRYLMDRDR